MYHDLDLIAGNNYMLSTQFDASDHCKFPDVAELDHITTLPSVERKDPTRSNTAGTKDELSVIAQSRSIEIISIRKLI